MLLGAMIFLLMGSTVKLVAPACKEVIAERAADVLVIFLGQELPLNRPRLGPARRLQHERHLDEIFVVAIGLRELDRLRPRGIVDCRQGDAVDLPLVNAR